MFASVSGKEAGRIVKYIRSPVLSIITPLSLKYVEHVFCVCEFSFILYFLDTIGNKTQF